MMVVVTVMMAVLHLDTKLSATTTACQLRVETTDFTLRLRGRILFLSLWRQALVKYRRLAG